MPCSLLQPNPWVGKAYLQLVEIVEATSQAQPLRLLDNQTRAHMQILKNISWETCKGFCDAGRECPKCRKKFVYL